MIRRIFNRIHEVLFKGELFEGIVATPDGERPVAFDIQRELIDMGVSCRVIPLDRLSELVKFSAALTEENFVVLLGFDGGLFGSPHHEVLVFQKMEQQQ